MRLRSRAKDQSNKQEKIAKNGLKDCGEESKSEKKVNGDKNGTMNGIMNGYPKRKGVSRSPSIEILVQRDNSQQLEEDDNISDELGYVNQSDRKNELEATMDQQENGHTNTIEDCLTAQKSKKNHHKRTSRNSNSYIKNETQVEDFDALTSVEINGGGYLNEKDDTKKGNTKNARKGRLALRDSMSVTRSSSSMVNEETGGNLGEREGEGEATVIDYDSDFAESLVHEKNKGKVQVSRTAQRPKRKAAQVAIDKNRRLSGSGDESRGEQKSNGRKRLKNEKKKDNDSDNEDVDEDEFEDVVVDDDDDDSSFVEASDQEQDDNEEEEEVEEEEEEEKETYVGNIEIEVDMEGEIKEEKKHEDKEEDVNVDIQISAPVEKKGVRRARTKQKKQDEATKNMTSREKRRYNTVKQLHESHEVLRDIWDVVEKKGRIEGEMIAQPKDIVMQLLPFQLEGLDWMTKQEQSPVKGGVLADEMGMGKTIQTVSLLSTTRQDGQPTLVIVPTVALIQWKNEIQLYAPSLKVVMYYGTDRNKKSKELESKDVVLTTYAVLESCFRKQNYGVRRRGTMVKEQSMLHTINWHRVILDEAHNIKDRTSNTARASFALKATYRWCLSGTPLQNRVGELYSLIRFLQLKPFSMYFCIKCECKSIKWNFAYNEYHCQVCKHNSHQHVCFWNFEVLKPIQEYGASGLGLDAFRKLNLIIDLIMLRRTKVERAADLGLPPKIVTIRRDRFSPEELDFYTSLFSNSRRSFDTYASHGTVLNNYANIFELITKMRLAVNHPDLLTHKLASSGESSDLLVCSICHCEPEDPIASKCKHVYCRVCVSQYLESYGGSQPSSTTTSTSTSAGTPSCTMCFAVLTIDLTQPPIEYVQAGPLRSLENSLGEDIMITTPDTMVYKRSIVNRINMATWRSSTKIEALVEELQALRRSDCTIKSLVFSQFVNFLDLVQWRLNRAGFSVCRLDGHMSPSQRDAVIRTFMTKPQYTVFLVSLKAGGVALNLTEASHVFICDPWWNPAVEDQAMDRIHRLGQRRPIRTTKLIVENSIESRIVVLQEKKRDLFMSTIGKDTTALSRLSEEDMEYLFTS